MKVSVLLAAAVATLATAVPAPGGAPVIEARENELVARQGLPENVGNPCVQAGTYSCLYSQREQMGWVGACTGDLRWTFMTWCRNSCWNRTPINPVCT